MGGKGWWHGRGEKCEGGRGLRASEGCGWAEGRAGGGGGGEVCLARSRVLETSVEVNGFRH